MIKFENSSLEYANKCCSWLAEKCKLQYGRDYTWHAETKLTPGLPEKPKFGQIKNVEFDQPNVEESFYLKTDIIFVFSKPEFETYVRLMSL